MNKKENDLMHKNRNRHLFVLNTSSAKKSNWLNEELKL